MIGSYILEAFFQTIFVFNEIYIYIGYVVPRFSWKMLEVFFPTAHPHRSKQCDQCGYRSVLPVLSAVPRPVYAATCFMMMRTNCGIAAATQDIHYMSYRFKDKYLRRFFDFRNTTSICAPHLIVTWLGVPVSSRSQKL